MNITPSLNLSGDDPHAAKAATASAVGGRPLISHADQALPDGLAFQSLLIAEEPAPTGPLKHVNRPSPAARKSAPAPRSGPDGLVVPLPILRFDAPPDLTLTISGGGGSGSSIGADADQMAGALDPSRELSAQAVERDVLTDGPQASATGQAPASVDATSGPSPASVASTDPLAPTTPRASTPAILSTATSTDPLTLTTALAARPANHAKVASTEPVTPTTPHAARPTITSTPLSAGAGNAKHESPTATPKPQATRPEARPAVEEGAPLPARSAGWSRADEGGKAVSPAPDAGMASASANSPTGGRSDSNQRSGQKDKESPAPSSAGPMGNGGTATATILSVAIGQPAGGDKNLTPVSQVSPAKADGATSADATTAVRSAQNQLVMRHTATGELLHPELGRVQVSAHLRDGAVDVRLIAQRAETAAFLAPRVDAMANDARSVNVPVARVDVEDHGGRAGQPPTGWGDGGTKDERHAGQQAQDGARGDVEAPPTKRVRIVL